MMLITTNAKKIYNNVYQRILPILIDKNESHSTVELILSHYLNITSIDILMDESIALENQKSDMISLAINRLSNNEPIQYILKEADFWGRKFIVNSDVLIPRCETEYMVQQILSENSHDNLKVLDICTGSGCIAITLQKELSNPLVYALDICNKALLVAKENAIKHMAAIEIINYDILDPLLLQKLSLINLDILDIIVSNPPYVCMSEKSQMQLKVLNHEPHKALFVPDTDPLIFYKAIVNVAASLLKPNGRMYLEINELYGIEIADLLIEHNFNKIDIHKDLNKKNRWISCCNKTV